MKMDTDSWVLKIARARQHASEFHGLASALERQSRDQIVAIREGDDLVLRVDGTPSVPDELAIIAGDAIHNARSALEHVVISIAERGLGEARRPPSDAEERSMQFPMTDSPATWTRWKRKLSEFLPALAVELIMQEQPWWIVAESRKEDPTLTERDLRLIATGSLGRRLAELDNQDKHRRLSLALWFPGSVGISDDNEEADIDDLGDSGDEESNEIDWDSLPEVVRHALTHREVDPLDSDFYFAGGPIVHGAELGRYIRNDRQGPVGEVATGAQLRLVLAEKGLTGVVLGAPKASTTLRQFIDYAEIVCHDIVDASGPGGTA